MADTTQNILINIDLETGQVNSELDKLDSKLGGLGQNTNPQPFKSIRQEILAAREEAVRLAIAIEDAEAAGQNVDKLSERYNQVTQRAAQLNDAVGDVNASIANANPDNRLQGLVSIAQGAITAVQGVAGAFALIGVDAETAQVAVAKLQGLIALTDAIGSIDKITKGYKDLTAVINLSAIAQKANNAATAAAAIVQRAFTGSVVATGTAFKVLRTAIISTGIGALVVALGFAIAALVDFAESQSDVEKASSDAADALEREIKALDDLNTQIEGRNRVELARLKARGASEKAIRDKEIDDAYRAYERAFQLRQLAAEKYNQGIQNADKETFDRLTAGLDAATKQADKLYNDYLTLGYNSRAADLADEKRVQDEKLQKQEEINQKRKQDLKELNDFIDEQRIQSKQKNQSDAQNEIDALNRKYDRIIKLAKTYGKSTIELEKLRQEEITRITQEAYIKSIQQETDILIKSTERRIEFSKKSLQQVAAGIDKFSIELADQFAADGFDILGNFSIVIDQIFNNYSDLFDFRKKQIELERDLLIKEAEKFQFPDDTKGERKAALIKRIQEDAELQIKTLNEEIIKSKEKIQEIDVQALINIDQQALQKATDILERLTQKPLATLNKLIEKQRELLANSLVEIEKTTQQSFDVLENNYFTNFEKLQERREQKLIDESTYFKELLKLRLQYAVATDNLDKEQVAKQFEITKNFIDKVFEIQNTLFSARAGDDSFVRRLLGPSAKKLYDEALKQNSDYFKAATEQENAAYNLEKNRRIAENQETESLEKDHRARLLQIQQDYANNRKAINEATLFYELELFDQVGAAIGNLGLLFKEGSNASKAAAIAEIAINTATGFVRGLSLAQQTASAAPPPAVPFVFAAFYASQIAAVLGAAARAKQILAKTPGGSQGSTSETAPSTPSAINASLFNLPPEAQAVRVVGQPSQVVRAYITNEDLRSAQEKQAFLNKLSSF